MTHSNGLRACFALVAALGLSANAQTEEGMPLVDLRIPLDYHTNGQVRTQIFAAQARVPQGGLIEATDVRVEIYEDDGATETVVTADDCLYDREAKRVTSESEVSLESEGIEITGKGLDWNSEKKSVEILEDAVVVLDKKLPLKERLGGSGRDGKKNGE